MFYQQPYQEQVARLTSYARRALVDWNVQPQKLELIAYENNAVFRVEGCRMTYGLRIYRPNQRSYTEIESEWDWVAALHTDALPVPAQIGGVYTGALLGVDEPVYAALWRWMDGRYREPCEYTADAAAKVGARLARIHHASAQMDTARRAAIQRPRLDYEGLFGENSPYNPKAGQQYISDASQQTLDAVALRVREAMAQLDTEPEAFGLIHGDYIYKNTLFNADDEVSVIDFDHCGWGYYLYDMACPLLFFKPLPAYAALKDALWQGYTSVRPLPGHYREMLEVFVAGRYVASCRWVAGNAEHPSIRGKAAEIIDGRAAELRGFLQTGTL